MFIKFIISLVVVFQCFMIYTLEEKLRLNDAKNLICTISQGNVKHIVGCEKNGNIVTIDF